MESKFTPGPWKFNSDMTPETVEVLEVSPEADSVWSKGFLSKTIGVENTNGERLADVKAYRTKGFLQDFEQWEGNAKLIVSAPDMLTALQEIVALCEAGHASEEVKRAALEAINKATL